MTTTDPEELVERLIFEVLVDEDHDVIGELFVPSFDEPVPTIGGGLAESLAEVRASYEEFHEHVSITDVELLSVHASETEVLARWSAVTEYRDTYRGIQPTGKSKRHHTLTRARIEDGRIASAQQLRDTLETIPRRRGSPTPPRSRCSIPGSSPSTTRGRSST